MPSRRALIKAAAAAPFLFPRPALSWHKGATDFNQISYSAKYRYNDAFPTKFHLGDTLFSTWADDNNIYLSHCDSYNWNDTNIADGGNILISGVDGYSTSLTGTRINQMTQFGGFAQNGSDGANWKAQSIASIYGTLYCAVTRFQFPTSPPPYTVNAFGAQIIKSPDHGLTWTPLPPSVAEPYASPMFPGGTFCTPNFIQYGRDYSDGTNNIHNSNLFVYATSNNGGIAANDDHLVLGRCLISNMPNLNAADWSFFTGGDGMDNANWSSNAASATPIRTDQFRCSGGAVTFLPYYQKYIMVSNYNVGYPNAVGVPVGWEVLKSNYPWGPYVLIDNHIETAGYYYPYVVAKSVAVDGGRNFTIFCNGPTGDNNPATSLYCLHILTASLS